MRRNGWRYDALSEMGSAAAKICAAVFCRAVLIKSEVAVCRAQARRAGGTAHGLTATSYVSLIDVIEKGSGSGQSGASR